MGNDVEIKISTPAELSGAKSVEASLERQIGAAKALGKDFSHLQTQLDSVRKVIATADQSGEAGFLSRLGSQARELVTHVPGLQGVLHVVTSLASGPLGLIAGGFATIAAAARTAVAALNEFAGAEKVVAGLDAALARSGQLTDENRQKTQALAGAMQEATGIADDQWVEVLQRLVQFGSDVSGTLEKDAEAVKNLAGLMDGNLVAAADGVARAMQGNFQVFQRLGIEIDDHLSQTEKLEQLYQELAQRGGGQLEARSRTLSGQFQTLRNNTSDLLEGVGRLISQTGILQNVMRGGADVAQFWAETIGGVVPQVEGLENAARRTTEAMEGGATATRSQADAITAIKTQAEAATASLDKMLAKIRETKSREDQEDAAMKDLELAKIDAAVQQKRASPVQAAGARAEVELRYSARAQDREDRAAASQQAHITKNVEDRRIQEGSLQFSLDSEKKKQEQQDHREEQVRRLRLAEAEEDRLKKEMDRLTRYNSFQIDPGAQREQAEVGTQLANAVTAAGLQRRKVASIPEVSADVAGAQKALDEARRNNLPFYEKAQQRIGDIDEDRQAGRRVFGLRQEARQVRGQAAIGSAFDSAASDTLGRQARDTGTNVAKKQEELAKEFVSALVSIGGSTDSAIRSLRQEVATLRKQILDRR